MDTLKQWTLGVITAAIAGAVVLLLSPGGSMEKPVRTAVSLFLLVTMLSPFVGGINLSDFDLITEKPEKISTETANEKIINEMKNNLSEKISIVLKEEGIESSEISVDISINENKEMTVDRIKILIPYEKKGQEEKIKKALSRKLSVRAEVEVKE